MKSDRPSFQFYPDDWLSNSNLRRCTHEEKGIWMDILCILHDQEEYGVVRWPLKEVAKAIGTSASKVRGIVHKCVMKGADSDGTVEPLIYVPRSGRREGDPVILIAEQKGPVWYSSRMVIDEYKRMVRGGTEIIHPARENHGEAFGVSPKASPKASPKPSPKGGIGEGKNRPEQHSQRAGVSMEKAAITASFHEDQADHAHEGATETAQKTGENPLHISTGNVVEKSSACSQDSVQDFSKISGKFSENFEENLKKSSSTFHSDFRQSLDETSNADMGQKNDLQKNDMSLIGNDINIKNPSPKGGIGEDIGDGIGEGIGDGIGEAPKLHLTLHPSRARPSSSSSSSSSNKKNYTKKSDGEAPTILPTASADIENQNPLSPDMGNQTQTAPCEDVSGQDHAVREGSARHIPANITNTGNIEQNITTREPDESSEAGVRYPEGFEAFWDAYPVHVGKKPCVTVWAKKRLQNQTAVILADIALRKKIHRRWLDGFYTNPLTYLNQELWADDWTSSPALCATAPAVATTGNTVDTSDSPEGHAGLGSTGRSPVTRL